MSDRALAALAIALVLIPLAFGIYAVVRMFEASDAGDTAETVAWGVVLLGLWLSPSSRRERDR